MTAVVCDEVLIDLEPGDTTARRFAMAFDLGTTTVVATLVDLDQDLLQAAGLPPPDGPPVVHAADGVRVRIGAWHRVRPSSVTGATTPR